MSSVAATVDITEQPAIPEEVEENEDAGQPVNNEDAGRLVANEDAGPQSVSEKLDLLVEIAKELRKVMGHAERRHMSNNILPHETIRQIQIILDSFTIWGDVTWPMRSMRDWLLTYIRSLSIRYPRMEIDEMIRLAKQVVYEAFKRHVESTNAAGLRKFRFMVSICELIEGDDTSDFFIGCSLFLPQGSITVQSLRANWDTWPNFRLLRSRASTEAMLEMQTFVTITSPMTESAIAEHTRRFRESEPELLRADAAAAATAAAEAATAAAEAAAAAETDSWAAAAESQTVPETAAVES